MVRNFKSSIAAQILFSRRFIVVFGLLSGIFAPLTAMSIQSQDIITNEESLRLTVLNSEMKTGQYFHGNSTIVAGEKMNWYLRVHNDMGKPEYIVIKIKLLNSTNQSPDDTSNNPSLEPEIIILRQIVSSNSTWITPLNWTIVTADTHDGYSAIKEVTVNGEVIDNLNIVDSKGTFRIIMELWKYDTDTEDFEFAWSASDETRSVWNQIWFSVKS